MHKSVQRVLLLMIASAASGCSASVPTVPPRTKPTALVNVDDFAAEYREAVRTVAASLQESGDKAAEFYAEIEPKQNGQVLIFHLWHESAFEPRNRDVAGNPGGKCRDVRYDVGQRKVVQTLFWQ